MNRINEYFIQRPTLNPQSTENVQKTKSTNSNVNFNDILNQKINESSELKISKHAEFRMKERNINLTNDQIKRVNDAVQKADEKGVKDSLVVVDNVALVVSVKNKTIITAVDSKELKDNVFTNIDGAVII